MGDMKLEPGMLCRIGGGRDVKLRIPDMFGKVVRLIAPEPSGIACDRCHRLLWWSVEEDSKHDYCECCLEPVRPDFEPCDEEFADELNKMLGREYANTSLQD